VKIVRIAGENLASLPGPFDIDLEAGPLADAGVFAITGPTGAGKSTLLDAICLALYGLTPRLAGRGASIPDPLTEDDLSANDPRRILRRGAGSGWAEVVVRVGDRTYRARWSVRRARNNPGRRLQNVERRLTDAVDDAVIATGVRETQGAIDLLVGLDFGQFRRSVLLAQGDFAAFLDAPAQKRGELLERMTGSDLYARLSVAAHRRRQAAEQAVRALEVEQGDVRVLAPLARSEFEAWRDAATEVAATQRTAARDLERAAAWLGTAEREREALAQAEQALREAADAREGAGAMRARVRDAERTLRAMDVLTALEAARGEVGRAEADAERTEADRAEAADGLAVAESQVVRAEQAAERALSLWAEVEDEVVRARRMDTELQQATGAASAAERALADATADLASETQRAQALRETVDGAERQIAEIDAWMGTRDALGVVARAWPQVETALERLRAARAEVGPSAAAIEEATTAAAEARDALEKVAADRDTAQRRIFAARRTRDEARARCDANPRGAAEDALVRARQRVESARALVELESRAEGARSRLAAARAEHEAATEQVAAARAALDDATARQVQVEPARAEAARALEAARAALDLVDHRASLVDGEPCPLCGATAHPWSADTEAPGRALVETLRARLLELDGEHTRASGSVAAAGAHLQAAEVNVAGAAQRSADEARELAEVAAARAEIGRGAADTGEPWGQTTEPPTDLIALRGRLRDAQEALERAEVARKDAADAAFDLKEAEGALDLAEQAADATRRRALELEARREAAERRVEAAAAAHAEASEVAERSAESVGRVLEGVPGWPPTDEVAAAAFRDRWAESVATWCAKRDGRAQAEARAMRDRAQLAAHGDVLRDRTRRRDEARDTMTVAQTRLARLRADREACLAGRDPDQVAAPLHQAIRDAEKRRTDARERRSVLHGRVRSLEEQARRARERVRAAEEARGYAERAAEAAAAAAGASVEALLDRRAALDEASIEAQRAELARLDRACQVAEATLDERRRRHDHHLAQRPPAADRPAAVEASRAEAEAAAEAADRLRLEATRVLATDDDARARHANLAPEIAAAGDALRLWGGMADLIGHHDGRVFRDFAQSLTLEAVLVHANRHLRQLGPRYALRRVPGAHLELQVIDRDLGDAVRSPGGLSGGERFLVSLALALGLSSLSAERTRVESLFVDEGFGALDAETLESALTTLDALQADGRQVGVISHVQGLAERVDAQVQVVPRGAGLSAVRVVAAT
jgi:exonuclease SbcC